MLYLTEPTSNEVFAAMKEAVLTPSTVQPHLDTCFMFHLDDENKSFILNAAKDHKNKPNLVMISTTLDTIHRILNQELSPTRAFWQGKLRIQGNLLLALRLNMIFEATRKRLLQQQCKQTPKSKL